MRRLFFLACAPYPRSAAGPGIRPAALSPSRTWWPWTASRVPVVSPDGTRVVFTLSALDLEANRRRTDLWIVGVDGTGLRRLTNHPATDTSPVWSADGKAVWFLSSRSGSMQIWKAPVDGGEAVQITSLPLDVGSFVVSPDDRLLAVSLEVFPDCDAIDCTVKRLKAREAQKTTGPILRPSVHPALGHLVRRAPLARLRDAGRGRRRRSM